MNPQEIVEHVQHFAEILDGEFNLSPKGVPRIIMTGEQIKISLVYVAKSDIWKAFFPYPSSKQERKYFESHIAMLSFLREKGCVFNVD